MLHPNTIRGLGNRSYGLILGFLIVLNLGCGSLVMNFLPDQYPRFALLDFGFFLQPVRAVHVWFYVLMLVFTLFGINISICTVEAFFRLLKTKLNRRRQIAALFCHLSIILALAAHLHEGLAGSSQQMRIGSRRINVPRIGRTKTASVTRSTHPDGSLKDTEAVLDFESANGKITKRKISYNNPAIFNSGKDQVILLHGENNPIGLILADSKGRRLPPLTIRSPLSLAGGVLSLSRIFPAQNKVLFAAVTWSTENNHRKTHFLALDRRFKGHSQVMAGPDVYTFAETLEEASIHAMVRHNPSIPYMLASVLLLGAGCALLIPWGQQRKTT